MRPLYSALIALGLVMGSMNSARADINVVHTDNVNLNVGGMGQALGFGESVDDPYKSHQRAYVFLKQARLRMNGGYKDYSFNLEFGLGGEDIVAAPSPGVGLSLLDLSFNIPVHALGKSFVKVGQFKVPYGREGLTYSGLSLFNERSLNFLGFQVGRDVGVSLNLVGDNKTLIAGVFTGGGRDVPQEFLPEKLGVPLLVLRAGIGDVDQDPYVLSQSETQLGKTKKAVFVNALYAKDSLVGHSSVFNVKLANKSLILNGNWNPYLGHAPIDQGAWWQTGVDAAVRSPIGQSMTVSAEAEINYGGYFNKYGAVHLAGGRVQGGLSYQSFEFGLRYALLLPDKNFAIGTTAITGTDAIHEVTPAVTYHIDDQRLKLVLDFPILIGVPVVTEKGVGSYVLSELPNQTTVLTHEGNTVARQNVEQARLMLQAWF